MGRYFRRSTATDWARMWGGMAILSVIVFVILILTAQGDTRTASLIVDAFVFLFSVTAWVHFADQVTITSVRYQCSCGKPLQGWSTHHFKESPAWPRGKTVPIKPDEQDHPVRFYAVTESDVRQQLALADTEHDVWRADGSVASTGTHRYTDSQSHSLSGRPHRSQ